MIMGAAFSIVALLAAFFFHMWRRGVRDSVHLTNMIMLILLDQKEREHQQSILISFVCKSEYRNADILWGMVSTGLSEIARRLAPRTMAINGETMWNMNQDYRRDEGTGAPSHVAIS